MTTEAGGVGGGGVPQIVQDQFQSTAFEEATQFFKKLGQTPSKAELQAKQEALFGEQLQRYQSSVKQAAQLITKGYDAVMSAPILPALSDPSSAHSGDLNPWLSPAMITLTTKFDLVVANVMKSILSKEGDLRAEMVEVMMTEGLASAEQTKKAGMKEAQSMFAEAGAQLASAVGSTLTTAMMVKAQSSARQDPAVQSKQGQIEESNNLRDQANQNKRIANGEIGGLKAKRAEIASRLPADAPDGGDVAGSGPGAPGAAAQGDQQQIAADQAEIRSIDERIAAKEAEVKRFEADEKRFEKDSKTLTAEQDKLVSDITRMKVEQWRSGNQAWGQAINAIKSGIQGILKIQQTEAQVEAQIHQLTKDMLEKIYQGSLQQSQNMEKVLEGGRNLQSQVMRAAGQMGA